MPNIPTSKPTNPEKTAEATDGSEHRDWAPGEMADGTIDTFPLAELPQRLAEFRALEHAATDDDDLSDLDDIEKLFGVGENKPKNE